MNLQNIKNRYLQISIGLVYLWFGALKFFPNVSPAEELATNTIGELTFSMIPPNISIIMLAIWEVIVGLFFLLNLHKKITIRVAVVHMLLTFTPLYFFPDLIFNESILSLTLLGQYIIKNLIILGALGVLWLEVIQESTSGKEPEELVSESGFDPRRVFKFRGLH